MKRFLLILLSLLMALSTLALAACGNGGTEDASSFTVTWKQYNGDYIKMEPNVPAGTVPAFGQADPTRPDDAENSYVFAGWDPTPGPISGDVTYTATYTAIPKNKHEVTAGEFTSALNMDGMDVIMTGKIDGSDAKARMLSDYTMIIEMTKDGAPFWEGYYREESGSFTFVVADAADAEGHPVWMFYEGGISLDEMKQVRSTILYPVVLIKQFTSYEDYIYDQTSESYKARVEGADIELSFTAGKLDRIQITDDDGASTHRFSGYGTAVITADEKAAMQDAGLALDASAKREYEDHDWLYINAAKGSVASRTVYARFEVPETFNPATQFLIIAVQCDNCPDDPEGDDTYYSKDYFSASVSLEGKQLQLTYDEETMSYYTYLTTEEGGKTVSLGAGTYIFTVEATALKDLTATGQNEIRVAIGVIEP